LPSGTIWRVDIPFDGVPITSGTLEYGGAVLGSLQSFPTEEDPAALTPGETYYLYVLQDVAVPIERCLFEMAAE
jgi:hypothetical protein